MRAAALATLVGAIAACHAARPEPTAPATTASSDSSGANECTRDDDCVISGYAEGIDGCCDIESTCNMYVTSKAALEARKRNNKCRPSDPPLCPPMSPCEAPKYTMDGAACVHGACVAIERPVAP